MNFKNDISKLSLGLRADARFAPAGAVMPTIDSRKFR